LLEVERCHCFPQFIWVIEVESLSLHEEIWFISVGNIHSKYHCVCSAEAGILKRTLLGGTGFTKLF